MIRKSIILLALASQSLTTLAQKEGFTTPLTELYIPDVPGFVLSDKAPSSVDKPTTPRAFGISLLNLWQGGAVDATPYWFSSKPSYTFTQWIQRKFTAVETFNVSAATFKTDSTSNLSIGFRTQILRIYSGNRKQQLLNKAKEIQTLLIPELDEDDEPIDLTEKQRAEILKKLDELNELKKSDLFSLEIAAALIGGSRTNSFKGLSSEKSGVWMNLRWSPAKSYLDFTGVARYSWANNATPETGNDSSFLDLGAALHYDKEKFNFSIEYITRRDFSIKKNYTRFTAVFNYILSENVILVASLGKNFAEVDNIVSVFGVKFGLSRTRVAIQ